MSEDNCPNVKSAMTRPWQNESSTPFFPFCRPKRERVPPDLAGRCAPFCACDSGRLVAHESVATHSLAQASTRATYALDAEGTKRHDDAQSLLFGVVAHILPSGAPSALGPAALEWIENVALEPCAPVRDSGLERQQLSTLARKAVGVDAGQRGSRCRGWAERQ
eukprot:5376568-Pleurochrysis_carterae.AAC.1